MSTLLVKFNKRAALVIFLIAVLGLSGGCAANKPVAKEAPGEQRAATLGVRGLALEQLAVVAMLVGRVLRELLRVDLLGVGHIAQGHGLRILFVQHGLCARGGRSQHRGAGSQGHHENTAVGQIHVGTPSEGTGG